jgi:hypothetical protein
MVTGAVALMLEKDRTLTEAQLVPILQGGAHYFRSISNIRTDFVEFEDQGGPGELDIIGSFAVMDQMSDPALTLPSANESWITLSTDYMLADGSTATIAIIELRTADGEHAADLFAPSRLAPLVKVDGQGVEPPPAVVRRGPGVWFYSLLPRPGFGGQSITFGATFDGEPIVTPRTIPIATDPWTATYPSEATGGCSVAGGRRRGSSDTPPWMAWANGFALLALVRKRAAACGLRARSATMRQT